jgi:hypothetical protein
MSEKVKSEIKTKSTNMKGRESIPVLTTVYVFAIIYFFAII